MSSPWYGLCLLSFLCGVCVNYGCCRLCVMFICVRAIQTNKVYMINDKKSNQWSSICFRTGAISILVTMVISKV